MYPVLILRSELACLVILVFLFFTSRSYHIESESKAFARLLQFALLHVIFDIITVITVNHLDVFPGWVNWLCHVLFYISAILFSNELGNYVITLCYPQKAKKLYGAGHLLTAIYICCLSFLKIEYVADVGTNSSAGPAAIVGYGLAFLFFFIALGIIFTHMQQMPGPIKSALIPMMLVLMITEICQIIWRCVLFTGGAITIVTVGFFFSLENPVEVFKKKAMTDALTGVRSRSSYEEDVEKQDKQFREKPGKEYIFVFCDLNDLRNVNNRFGHAEGDNYISLIASAISRCMKHASAVYRIGGDEFLISYYRTDAATVEQEIKELQEDCARASEGLDYVAAISAGFACSDESYKSLRDVVKTADFAMYQNKMKLRNASEGEEVSFGTRLNYAGLTDRIFDAMCASNESSYPFITNLDTGVTRIAPGWKEYFGLDAEFYADFNGVWMQRIHPDYYQGYLDDVVAVINGHRRYHNFEYLARRADGEYARVSCFGSVYRDSSSGSRFFTGFMVNFSVNEGLDPVTGLQGFDVLAAKASRCMDEGKPFSVLKLKVNNFARVNMLYGYSGGNEVVVKIAEVLRGELGDRGEVFCQGSVNFSILFETTEESELEAYYRKVSSVCASGMETEIGTVPVQISGGAMTNHGEHCRIERIRSGLVYALEESHYYRRNALVFYREPENTAVGGDISLLAQIHADALGEMENFRLRYQPIVDISSGKTVGAEALLRWYQSGYGEIQPGQFIAFLENDPCYYRLGLFILDQAIRDAKRLRERIPEFRMNVNITALQLQNEHFTEHVFDILKKYDYAPGGLVLELTERCKEMDGDFLAAKIAELRSRGILIAFDDLGTGYSTINLLMDIPVDEIKLDKDFVHDIPTRENCQLFVRALVLGSAAQGNNFNICFEGVENQELLGMVSRFGNYLAQGYYFAEPMLIEEFVAFLEQKA